MGTPVICDVCERIMPAARLAVSQNSMGTAPAHSPCLPDGWQYISLSSGILTLNGEVCSKSCALKFIDRRWAA
jgi:hypothetical protein